MSQRLQLRYFAEYLDCAVRVSELREQLQPAVIVRRFHAVTRIFNPALAVDDELVFETPGLWNDDLCEPKSGLI